MQENFTMIKMTEISLTPMTKMRHVQCKMLSLRKTKSLNTPCSPCVHFGKEIWFNDLDRFSVRILFGFNQLTVHVYYFFYQQTWNKYEMNT